MMLEAMHISKTAVFIKLQNKVNFTFLRSYLLLQNLKEPSA
jgi:hypothetical protein